jgi:hypothetical protein
MATIDLAKLVVRLEAQSAQLISELERARTEITKFQKHTNDVLTSFRNVAVAAFTIDKIKDFVTGILDAQDHLAKFAQSAGESVEEVSALSYAMKSSGVDASDIAGVFKNLNEKISEAANNAKSEAAVQFKALGISVRDASGQVKTGSEVMKEAADRFKTFGEGAVKSADAVAFFGKQGATLLPFLNQGSEGIAKLEEKARQFGATVSGETAAAAEKFNDKLSELKTQLVDGLGNRVAAEVLPGMNALAQVWDDDRGRAQAFADVAGVLAITLKGIVAVGIVVVDLFQNLGQAIYTTFIALNDIREFDFKGALDELKDGIASIRDNASKDVDKIKALFDPDNVLQEVVITAKKMTDIAPDLVGGKALQDAIDAAVKKLKDLDTQLSGQVATFGLGEGAAIKYRLTLGDLADEVKKAGAAGAKFAADIQKQADALQRLKDQKDAAQGIADINAEIAKLSGDVGDAAVLELDKKFTDVITKLRRLGDDAALSQYNLLVKLTAAQADYNDELQKGSVIQDELSRDEERINRAQQSGALTELQAQKQLGDARRKAAEDLTAIADAQQKIADQSDNDKQKQGVAKLRGEIEKLKETSDLVGQSIRNTVQKDFEDFGVAAVKNIRDVGDAFGGLINNIADMLLRMSVQWAANKFFNWLVGSTESSDGSQGIFSTVASLFTGGGRAMGGAMNPGIAYDVNEVQPEKWVADQPGRVEDTRPWAGRGGMSVTQYISVQAPKGTVSRGTLTQTGAAAARQLQQANARNN